MSQSGTMERLSAANPCPVLPEVAAVPWASAQLASILAAPNNELRAESQPRRRSRRVLVLATAGATLVAGGALAVTLERQATEATQQQVRAELSLPSLERDGLDPLPGGITERLRTETPYGPWVVVQVTTHDRGVLLVDGLLRPDGSLVSPGIGRCDLSSAGTGVRACRAAERPLGAQAAPALSITGAVASNVAKVELRGEDGTKVTGYAGGGAFLVLLDSPARASATLIAESSDGSVVGTQELRLVGGTGLLVPEG